LRGESFNSIARALKVSRNHVRHVALGLRESPRVSAAIAKILKRPAAVRASRSKKIARRCDVSRPHVSQVVHGKRDSRRIRAAIIKALGFDPWQQPKKGAA
jgi:transcriptional regulator with XRE-family HTH domain